MEYPTSALLALAGVLGLLIAALLSQSYHTKHESISWAEGSFTIKRKEAHRKNDKHRGMRYFTHNGPPIQQWVARTLPIGSCIRMVSGSGTQSQAEAS